MDSLLKASPQQQKLEGKLRLLKSPNRDLMENQVSTN